MGIIRGMKDIRVQKLSEEDRRYLEDIRWGYGDALPIGSRPSTTDKNEPLDNRPKAA